MKVIFQKMGSALLALLVVFAVTFAIAMPSSAVGNPNHFYIPFQLFTAYNDHGKVSFPVSLTSVGSFDALPIGNSSANDVSNQDGSWQLYLHNLTQNNAQTAVTFSFTDYEQSLHEIAYVLSATEFSLPRTVLRDNALYIVPQGEDAMLEHEVNISFAVTRMVLSDGEYVPRTYTGNASAYFVNGIDINKLIYDNLPDAFSGDTYLRFERVNVAVENGRTASSSMPGFSFTVRGVGNGITASDGLGAWLAQFDLTRLVYNAPDIEEVDFTSWLSASVGSILNFEIWPGMTIDVLIRFVVTAGLLLWFITMVI